jgi:hypothetical protein
MRPQKHNSNFFLTFYFYFATYNNLQQAECIKKSTNVRGFGEKVTHRYHSVDILVNKNQGNTRINITIKNTTTPPQYIY